MQQERQWIYQRHGLCNGITSNSGHWKLMINVKRVSQV